MRVKPKTSAAYEIDIYDTVMRELKHITTNTPQDKSNSNPIWSKDVEVHRLLAGARSGDRFQYLRRGSGDSPRVRC